MNFEDDFDFFNDCKPTNLINDYDKENLNFDLPMCHSTPSFTRSYQVQRPLDYPSIEKHYGIVNFSDYQLPIIYRLINESFYIPYIRFSYVLNIFEHSSYKKFFVNINNLPVIEMTPIERIYYDEISPSTSDSDWSHYQLLSVSVFDGVLAILNLTEYFHSNSSGENAQWHEAMNKVRQDARDRWILDEKIVLTRLAEQKQVNSTCISSTSIAKRRALLEQRVRSLPSTQIRHILVDFSS